MIVDPAARTITDRAVPYGVVGIRNGLRYQFDRWSILWGDPARVKLRAQHDPATTIGKALEITDTADGIYVRMSVTRGRRGDRALALAGGVWRGLSIGLADDITSELRDDDVYHCLRAVLVEISLTPNPAFTLEGAA